LSICLFFWYVPPDIIDFPLKLQALTHCAVPPRCPRFVDNIVVYLGRLINDLL
jgi:hypothetical protein